MAYDEDLAERVRLAMADVPDLIERKMFGGLAFMAGDHMAVGIARNELMVRLGKEGATAALDRLHVRRMDMTGTPMTSIVLVAPAGLADDDALQAWVDEALAFVRTLPPKRRRERRGRPA
jgi:TfoX/Sxy family transcriptional regulator of competence genes